MDLKIVVAGILAILIFVAAEYFVFVQKDKIRSINQSYDNIDSAAYPMPLSPRTNRPSLARIDETMDIIDKKLDRMDAKIDQAMDRLEEKIDQLENQKEFKR